MSIYFATLSFLVFLHKLASDCTYLIWSRGKSAGSVRSLVTRQFNGSFVLFALHEDGTLRVWDLLHRYRVLNHSLSTERELEGRSFS